MKRNLLTATLLVTVATCAAGCFTAAKETVGGIQGAKGIFQPLEPRAVDSGLLASYSRFELGELKDDFAGRVPPELYQYLPEEYQKAMADKGLPTAGAGKTAVIRGSIFYYEDQRFLGVVVGNIEEVLARLQVVDKASGTVLATAVCVGRTDTRTTIGVRNKAEGLGRAIALWISANRPKPPKEKE